MIKYIQLLVLGVLFGIIMSKSEAISWFRIYEMFKFQSFHMYGIIGTAVILGLIITRIIKKYQLKDFNGEKIVIADKEMSVSRYLLGGVIFGLGWALVGACPGPMFVLLGHGFFTISLVIIGGILGTYLYGLLRNKLPH